MLHEEARHNENPTVIKLLVDECLHLSLVDLARAAGLVADHVNHLGLGGFKDWKLMAFVLKHDYAFVTNNRSDFLGLYNRAPLHAGLIIIVPNVTPSRQRELFQAALDHIADREPVKVRSRSIIAATVSSAANIPSRMNRPDNLCLLSPYLGHMYLRADTAKQDSTFRPLIIMVLA
jgi:predicted nuclease of predicted toxin-antitoxin system